MTIWSKITKKSNSWSKITKKSNSWTRYPKYGWFVSPWFVTGWFGINWVKRAKSNTTWSKE